MLSKISSWTAEELRSDSLRCDQINAESASSRAEEEKLASIVPLSVVE